jgi:hypothetical protein
MEVIGELNISYGWPALDSMEISQCRTWNMAIGDMQVKG